jgi:hypothetical protein
MDYAFKAACWLLIFSISGCSATAPLALDSPEASDVARGATVRVTMTDGEKFWLHGARLQPDTLKGLDKFDVLQTIPLANVSTLELKRQSVAGHALGGVGIALFAGGIALLMVGVACIAHGGCFQIDIL